MLKGRRVAVQALGCRTNLAEAESIASAFVCRGALIVEEAPFDAAVIVTCSVTAMADRKSRQLIHRFRRLSPGACIVACGCWAQGVGEDLARGMGVNLLVGNRLKSEIPDRVERFFEEKSPKFQALRGTPPRRWDALELDRPLHHSRAFIKVQDGCDHGCTYCIVPSLRGPSVSRPAGDILEEARRCLGAGCLEIVLTGVHLGLFGRDSGESFAALIRGLGALEGLKRLRFGSLEPFCVDGELLDALAETPSFCRHLHLPLQSGDDGVLRRMGRGHGAEDYLALVRRLRDALGQDLHISTDVMCAFPGESEAAFQNTLDLMKAARIGRVHGFRYSPRAGTPAASMPCQVESSVAEDRAERLKRAGLEQISAEAARWVGREVPVLFEGEARGKSQGYTPQYIEFHLKDGKIFREERLVRAVSQNQGVLFGDLIKKSATEDDCLLS